MGSWTKNLTAANLVAGVAVVAAALAGFGLLYFARASRKLRRELAKAAAALEPAGLQFGDGAPVFELPDLTGATTSSATLRRAGRPLVLLFATPICGPCTELLPQFERWSVTLAEQLAFAVVESLVPDASVLAARFGQQSNLAVLTEADLGVAIEYGVTQTPTAFLIDADGRVATAATVGAAAIERLVRNALQLATGGRERGRIVALLRRGRSSTRITGAAYGVAMTLEASPPELLADMRAYLPPAWEDDATGTGNWDFRMSRDKDGRYELYHVDRVIAGGPADEVLEGFEHMVRLRFATSSPTHFFLHAGAVAHRGLGIVIPGASFSGKTTLVSALVRAGAVYYTDENAVLDDRGLLHPYPKPLGVREVPGEPDTDGTNRRRAGRCRRDQAGARQAGRGFGVPSRSGVGTIHAFSGGHHSHADAAHRRRPGPTRRVDAGDAPRS